MHSAAFGHMTARKLLEQFGLLTLPLKAKKRPKRKENAPADKAAGSLSESAVNALRRHI
jgi:hypothetical protein